MPFAVDDLRVLCHTRNASRTYGQLSGAEWVLKAPVMPPNPSYKIKAHVTSMQIPNSFEHVGPRQMNDTLVVIKRHLDTGDTWEKAVARGDYVKVILETRDGHIANVRDYFESLTTLERGVNNGLVAAHKQKTSWKGTSFVPQMRIDKKGYPVMWAREMYLGTETEKVERGLDIDDNEPVSDQMEVAFDSIRTPYDLRGGGTVKWRTGRTAGAETDSPFFLLEYGPRTINKPGGIGFIVKGEFIDKRLKALFFPNWERGFNRDAVGVYEDIEDDDYYACIAHPNAQDFIPVLDESNTNTRPPESFGMPRLWKIPKNISSTELQFHDYFFVLGLDGVLIPTANFTIHSRGTDNQRPTEVKDTDPALHLGGGFGDADGDAKDTLLGELFFRDPVHGERIKRFYFQEFLALYNSVLREGLAGCRFNEKDEGAQTREKLELLPPTRNGSGDPVVYVYPRTAYAGGRDAMKQGEFSDKGIREQLTVEYKVLTQFDIIHNPAMARVFGERDVGLAQLIGYTRFVYTPPVNVPANVNEPPQSDGKLVDASDVSFMPTGVATGAKSGWSDGVVAQAPTDFSGIRYIKVFTSMNVSAVDQDLNTAKLIAICPTVGGNAVESNYMVGSLQQSQTFTLSDSKIDRIRFDLTDDFNRPVEMWRDWWVDVTFSFEEPYSVDHYQGISNLVNIGTRFTTEGYDFDSYSTVTRDVGDELDRLAGAEQRNRRRNADLGTKRKHGPGGY